MKGLQVGRDSVKFADFLFADDIFFSSTYELELANLRFILRVFGSLFSKRINLLLSTMSKFKYPSGNLAMTAPEAVNDPLNT